MTNVVCFTRRCTVHNVYLSASLLEQCGHCAQEMSERVVTLFTPVYSPVFHATIMSVATPKDETE